MSRIVIGTALAVCLAALTLVAQARDTRERRPNPRSCYEASLCCQQQNNTCFVFGDRMDADADSGKCYCDTNCIIMGDCCTDYHHTCKSVSCEVSGWTEWTECDNGCGFGMRRRTRDVHQFPSNGGKLCPALKQRRACVGYVKDVCRQNFLHEQAIEKREQARLLPISFSKYRGMKKYDPYKGILKNLFENNFNEILPRATYRGKFRITKAHYGCQESEEQWPTFLEQGKTVCVECQPVAMNRKIGMRCLGHGVPNARTKWTAVNIPHCHGEWELLGVHEARVCDYDIEVAESRNFIFI